MADMGLGMMGGAAGAGDAIAQLFDQRLKAAQLGQQDALTRLKVQEVADARAETIKQREESATQRAQDQAEREQGRQDRLTESAFTATPAGTRLAPIMAQNAQRIGLPLVPIAGNPVQQISGFQSAPGTENPTAQASITPDPSSPLSVPPGLARGQTQADIEKGKQDDNANWRAGIQQELADVRSTGHAPTPHYSFLPTYDETGKPTGIAAGNTLTGTVANVQGAPIVRAAPGAAADAKSAGDTKKAINVIGQVDQSLDSVKDLVGPAAGRGETVEQWLGSADPKIQAFGTKLLLAKMLIDKQVTGSARAGASPALLAKWDALLSNKVSYEGMKAALQAAKEIVGAGMTDSGSGPRATGADPLGLFGK